MEIAFTQRALDDIAYWKQQGNQAITKRITDLTHAILEALFTGIGKPEPLKHQHSGKWSRRITAEHRYVYRVENDTVYVFSLRGHYAK